MKTDDCKKYAKLLSAYVDGELSADQKKLVQNELSHCQVCQTEYERLLRLRALVWENSQEAMRRAGTGNVWDAIEDRIGQIDQARKMTLSRRVSDWFERMRLGLASPLAPAGIATATATVLVAGVLMFMAYNGNNGTDQMGGSKTIALPSIQSDTKDPATTPGLDGPEQVAASAGNRERRPAAGEASFRRNECYVDSTSISSGIVIVDVDPEEDIPVIVWHFTDDPLPDPGEDGAI